MPGERWLLILHAFREPEPGAGTTRFAIGSPPIVRMSEAIDRKPDSHEFECHVDGGLLDVGYARGSVSFPMISALEIERMD